MRVTLFDRWLLVGASLCFGLLIASPEKLDATCDTKCRHVTIYFSAPAGPVVCKTFKFPDCLPCDVATKGTCDDSNPLQAGTCLPSADTDQQSAPTMNCQLRCTLVPGGTAEALKGNAGGFMATSKRLCQQ